MIRFQIGSLVRFFPKGGRWAAPVGSLAHVSGYDRIYIQVKWVREPLIVKWMEATPPKTLFLQCLH